MRSPLLSIILCILILPASAIQIIEFCPDTYLKGEYDEYIVLEGYGPLDGVRISDYEGSVRFPEGSQILGTLTISRIGDAYSQTHGLPPDFEIFDSSPSIPDVIRSGELRMCNDKDELILVVGETTVQEISWPADVTPREGQVHFMENGTWDPRPLLIGQSRFRPVIFSDAEVTAFVSPDCSREVLEDVLTSAQEDLLVNVYEFTDPGIAGMLVDAGERGLSVQVLVEGGPVGGISQEEKGVIGLLRKNEIPVYQMTSTTEAHAKYRFDHAKYIVIDGEGVLITSENFKPGGFPKPGNIGNRGWGAYIRHEGVAAYFEDVFEWDSTGGDSILFDTLGVVANATHASPYTPEFSAQKFSHARVTPVLSPDTSLLIIDLIESARSSIDIEQAYITNWSENDLNPYLKAAINASRRGVSVRVLLDSYWYNVNEDLDNDEMATFINRLAGEEQLPISARCANLNGNNPEKIHNKGMIVDKNSVLISSINWNENSPNFNREAGIIVDHPGLGAYYTAVFEDDWNAADNKIGENDFVKTAAAGSVLILLLFLYIQRRM
jgi:cardiolipin synthase